MNLVVAALLASLNLSAQPALAQSAAINPYVAFDVPSQYYRR
jgi:hypothetical protein